MSNPLHTILVFMHELHKAGIANSISSFKVTVQNYYAMKNKHLISHIIWWTEFQV